MIDAIAWKFQTGSHSPGVSGRPGHLPGARRVVPSTPEEDVDAMVLGTSFHFGGQGTATVAHAMKRYCGLLGEQEVEGMSPAQWPAAKEHVTSGAAEDPGHAPIS
ncbi:hypothetical protein [Streptomyces sp. Caat 7-52]|uniref:hypothetical protein n=1 Tax=Streptomyces sp. Caat 7-52 TaxID=2949637 RepID=UPI0020350AF7|nr:hypothetical protein [Streptomyces sp. Caat 7-52]